jgi:hypothetical protein
MRLYQSQTYTFAQVTVTGVAKFANGTAANPSIAFASDPDNGLYFVGGNTVGASAGGIAAFQWDNQQLYPSLAGYNLGAIGFVFNIAFTKQVARSSVTHTTGALALDGTSHFIFFTGAGAGTLTLPAANVFGTGNSGSIVVKHKTGSANTCTIQRAGADVIDTGSSANATSFTIPAGESRTLETDGVSIWSVV